MLSTLPDFILAELQSVTATDCCLCRGCSYKMDRAHISQQTAVKSASNSSLPLLTIVLQ